MATTNTKIQWTDRTWNFVRGCARVSPGCENCYAERTAYRFNGKGQPYEGLTVLGKRGPRWSGEARFVTDALWQPLKWRDPAKIFCNSMSDVFHEDVTDEQIAAACGVMAACPQHTFQLLTKRADRMCELMNRLTRQDVLMAALDLERETHAKGDAGPLHVKQCADPDGPWPLPNIWLGVSCEDQQRADERIPLLLQTPAAVRFVSAEPLLGPVTFDPNTLGCVGHLASTFGNPLINWVIVGGESGPGARPCNIDWVRSIATQCNDAGTACFVKQLGRFSYAETSSVPVTTDRKGGDMAEWPSDLRVRQFPEMRA